MENLTIRIDKLIDIVSRGGYARTGVDVYNDKGVLLLEKNVVIKNINPLLVMKKFGVGDVTIDREATGGLWDKSGTALDPGNGRKKISKEKKSTFSDNIEKKFSEIKAQKKEASVKHENAKKNIKKVISEIQNSGGEFDVQPVEDTVNEILNFLSNNNTAFSYLSKEIFSYDDYLYNHSVNACTIGTAVLMRFNDNFGEIINNYLSTITIEALNESTQDKHSFIYYLPDELKDISLGYFLHDIGKVLIPNEVLNKKGDLSDKEFELVKKHSYEKGVALLEKNHLLNPYIYNSVKYHHNSVYKNEAGCYPDDKHPIELPPYVKICKLADIYDAMTSKRCYKEAFNPVGVVTDIYRKYGNRDKMLQFILRSFVRIVGIYPPGSVVRLNNSQLAMIMDTEGPIVIPFTDEKGEPLRAKQDPIDLSEKENFRDDINIDRRAALKTPREVYDKLPSYLKIAIDSD